MSRHIFFVSPENLTPTGGVNVMFQSADILDEQGWSSSVHFQSSDYTYTHYPSRVKTSYTVFPNDFRDVGVLRGLGRKLGRWSSERRKPRRPGANHFRTPGRSDLVVLPDFWISSQVPRFSGLPTAILAQDVFGSIRGSLGPMARGKAVPQDFRGFITTSKASQAAVRAFGNGAHYHVPLFLGDTEFAFHESKKRQICFMPRRRNDEVVAMTTFLKSRVENLGFDLVPIEGMSWAEVRRTMAESLIFLSFSRREGFGLPPAEAMAMGCLTIGYTGVGGDEYFTPDIAFPVPEDNFVAFYNQVVSVLERYVAEPGPLDEMRKRASERILTTYTRPNTTSALVTAMERMTASNVASDVLMQGEEHFV